MTTDLGGLTARVGLNTTGLRTGRVAAEAELVKVEGALLKTEGAATRLGNSLGGLGKLAGAVVGFELLRKGAEGIKSSIQYAIDLEATMRRVNGVFGASSKSLVDFADSADASLGRTKESALQSAVHFGTLATQFGATRSEAAKMSIELTKLATDMAASKGTSIEQAEVALATGLVGRGRALRLYGVDVSNAALHTEALKEKLIQTSRDALDPATKFQAAYNLILEQTSRVQGYFAKNTDLTQEKLAIAKSTLRDASEELGVSFAPAAKKAADILANDVAPALKQAGDGIKFISEHKTASDIIAVAGGIGLLAVATARVGKALKETGDFFRTTFGHGENAAAIKAEGDAAEVAAGKLLALRDAEVASGTAAGTSAAERGAGSAFSGGLTAAEVLTLRGKTPFIPNPAARAGLGAVGGIGTGLVISEIADGLFRKIGADGKSRGGVIGTAESLYSKVEQGTNPVSIVKNAWDVLFGGSDPKKPAAKPLAAAPLRLSPLQRATANLAASRSDVSSAVAFSRNANVQSSENSLLGGVLGGSFDLLPTATKGSADSIAAANIAVANAQARVDKLRAGSGGASPSSLASAQAAVLSAEDTLRKGKGDSTVETLRLQAAEDRLNTLRAGSKVNTKALATAEAELVLARKKADTAAGSTALSVGDLLKRQSGQLTHTRDLANDSAKLIKLGVSQPVLEQIDQLEKTAPGTLDRLASTMTRAQAAALDKHQKELQVAQHDFLTAPLRAAIETAKAENAKRLQQFAAAERQAYANALAGRSDPNTNLLTGGGVGKPARPGRNAPPTLQQMLGLGGVTVNMPHATIVANDPAALAAAAARQARINNLAGRP